MKHILVIKFSLVTKVLRFPPSHTHFVMTIVHFIKKLNFWFLELGAPDVHQVVGPNVERKTTRVLNDGRNTPVVCDCQALLFFFWFIWFWPDLSSLFVFFSAFLFSTRDPIRNVYCKRSNRLNACFYNKVFFFTIAVKYRRHRFGNRLILMAFLLIRTHSATPSSRPCTTTV